MTARSVKCMLKRGRKMFPTELDVRVIPGGQYLLLSPFVYAHENGGQIRVPKGFKTDFASIPRGFRWLVTGHDGTRKPAVIHDYLYRNGAGNRKDADLVFRAAMRDTGVPAWKRNLCYWAVRMGGGGSWNG